MNLFLLNDTFINLDNINMFKIFKNNQYNDIYTITIWFSNYQYSFSVTSEQKEEFLKVNRNKKLLG